MSPLYTNASFTLFPNFLQQLTGEFAAIIAAANTTNIPNYMVNVCPNVSSKSGCS